METADSSDAKPVVMVVEPEVLVRMTIADVLRECGYKVIEGIVAEDVFKVLGAGAHLDIVFSEVQLAGGADGFALARRVRQTNPEIDVILTSGVDGAAEKSKDLCEEGPMKKPYQSQDVVARIKLLLERRRSSRRRQP
jgi:DNA-binding response OmpR family regulator